MICGRPAPRSPLFVDVRGQALSTDQVKYLIERLYIRAGLRARVPAGALVHALRHTFATSALEAGADVVELQTLLGYASLDTTRRYLDATTEGLRQMVRGHPGQVALREHLRKAELSSRSGSGPGGVRSTVELEE